MTNSKVNLKRVYDPPAKADGFRILVDRLWPRGLTKEKARVDLWLKDIAPSNELRKWYSHDLAKWNALKKKYEEDLRANPQPIAELRKILREKKKVTLLFSSSETARNNAVALKEILRL